MLLRALGLWLVLAVAETVHGILRVRFLNRKVGDRRARQIGVVSGSLLILALVWPTITWIEVRTSGDCLVVGLLWSILMLTFDFALGRYCFGFSWARLTADLNLRQGGFLGFGLGLLFLAPLIVASLRGLI
ncbi:MAG TPA: hypothetical protein PLG56_00400 [Lacunisphaera sp.]|nr:hypothetical protein [Lacunisphaera sp.]